MVMHMDPEPERPDPAGDAADDWADNHPMALGWTDYAEELAFLLDDPSIVGQMRGEEEA